MASSKTRLFLQRWGVTTLGVLVAANVVNGIRYDSFSGLVVAALLLGILNAFVRPLMILLALPLLVFTLGLFILVINAVLLYLVGSLLNSFHVESFRAAFWGGLLISIVSLLVNWILGTSEPRVQMRSPPRSPPGPPPDGGGPIIDV